MSDVAGSKPVSPTENSESAEPRYTAQQIAEAFDSLRILGIGSRVLLDRLSERFTHTVAHDNERERCSVVCFVGPGHQSKVRCQLPAGHRGVHEWSETVWMWDKDGECID